MVPRAVAWTDARQARIHERLARISPGLATLFRDACRFMAGVAELEATPHFAAHACREIESGVRDVLRGVAGLGKIKGHKNDIAAILKSLGIDDTDPIGRLWMDLPNSEAALDEMAHRSRLGVRSRSAFDAGWQMFQAIMDFVLDRHEATSSRAFAIIDDLVLRPSRRSLTRLQTSIPQNRITLSYFFDRAGAEWVELLDGTPYMTPDDEPDTDGRLPVWPAGRWLVRIAVANQVFALDALDKIATSRNPDAVSAALDTIRQMQPEMIATRTSQIAVWVRIDVRSGLGERGADLVAALAGAGYSAEALEISRALLDEADEPDG